MIRQRSFCQYTQTVSLEIYEQLKEEARKRDVSISELVRAVIIPEYYEDKE